MSTTTTHADLHRSIAAMGFGLQVEIAHKAAETARQKLHEVDQQFRIDVSGLAGTIIAWSDAEIVFPETLYYAPLQRDSNRLRDPHVYFGSVLKSAAPVIITGIVASWITDRSGNFTGAKIKIGAYAPGTTAQVQFQAQLHVTVQGYGAPVDTDHGESDG